MQPNTKEQTEKFLESHRPISLEEMQHVALMDRVDTKFVGASDLLPDILAELESNYKVLEIEGDRVFLYYTHYYDTKAYGMYEAHQNGKLNRYKVRKREYVSSGLRFLEVKFKNNKRRTIKKRVERQQNEALTAAELIFLDENTPFNGHELEHKLSNSFYRITMVGAEERVTIDFGLSFKDANGFSMDFDDIVVIELKQLKFCPTTRAMNILRKFKIKSQSFSKYCLGAASLNTHIKANRMKQKFELIERIKAEIEG